MMHRWTTRGPAVRIAGRAGSPSPLRRSAGFHDVTELALLTAFRRTLACIERLFRAVGKPRISRNAALSFHSTSVLKTFQSHKCDNVDLTALPPSVGARGCDMTGENSGPADSITLSAESAMARASPAIHRGRDFTTTTSMAHLAAGPDIAHISDLFQSRWPAGRLSLGDVRSGVRRHQRLPGLCRVSLRRLSIQSHAS